MDSTAQRVYSQWETEKQVSVAPGTRCREQPNGRKVRQLIESMSFELDIR